MPRCARIVHVTRPGCATGLTSNIMEGALRPAGTSSGSWSVPWRSRLEEQLRAPEARPQHLEVIGHTPPPLRQLATEHQCHRNALTSRGPRIVRSSIGSLAETISPSVSVSARSTNGSPPRQSSASSRGPSRAPARSRAPGRSGRA